MSRKVMRGRNLGLRPEHELVEGVARIREIEAALSAGQLDPDQPDRWLADRGIPLNDQWRNSVRLAHGRLQGGHGKRH